LIFFQTTTQPSYHMTVGGHSVFKKLYLLYMNSDGDKLYRKSVGQRDLQFCSSNFLHLKLSSDSNNRYIIQIWYQNWDLDSTWVIWTSRWLLMKKCLSYKVVDLIESYNFHIKFTYIRIHTKQSYDFFENRLFTIGASYGGWNTVAPSTAVSYVDCGIVFEILRRGAYFWKMVIYIYIYIYR
jgi:hypothetical protein